MKQVEKYYQGLQKESIESKKQELVDFSNSPYAKYGGASTQGAVKDHLVDLHNLSTSNLTDSNSRDAMFKQALARDPEASTYTTEDLKVMKQAFDDSLNQVYSDHDMDKATIDYPNLSRASRVADDRLGGTEAVDTFKKHHKAGTLQSEEYRGYIKSLNEKGASFGAKADQEYAREVEKINLNPQLSPEQKTELLQKLKDKFSNSTFQFDNASIREAEGLATDQERIDKKKSLEGTMLSGRDRVEAYTNERKTAGEAFATLARRGFNEDELEEFVEFTQSNDMWELVDADLGYTSQASYKEIKQKDEQGFIGATKETVGQIGDLVETLDTGLGWSRLWHGMATDETLVESTFLGAGGGAFANAGVKAITSGKKMVDLAQRFSKTAKVAKTLKAKQIAAFSADAAGESVGSSMLIGLNTADANEKLNVGAKDYIMYRSVFEESVTGIGMGAGTASLKRVVGSTFSKKPKLTPEEKAVKVEELKARKEAGDNAITAEDFDNIGSDEAKVDVNEALGIKVNETEVDGSSKIQVVLDSKITNANLAKRDNVTFEGKNKKEKRKILRDHFTTNSGAFNIFKENSSDMASVNNMRAEFDLGVAKLTYDKLGDVNPAEDIYKNGSKNEILLDGQTEYVYHNGRSFDTALEPMVSPYVNRIETKKLKEQFSGKSDPDLSFAAYLYREEMHNGHASLYMEASFNPKNFDGSLEFKSENMDIASTTAHQAPLDLTGMKLSGFETIKLGDVRERSRWLALSEMNIDESKIKEILPMAEDVPVANTILPIKAYVDAKVENAKSMEGSLASVLKDTPDTEQARLMNTLGDSKIKLEEHLDLIIEKFDAMKSEGTDGKVKLRAEIDAITAKTVELYNSVQDLIAESSETLGRDSEKGIHSSVTAKKNSDAFNREVNANNLDPVVDAGGEGGFSGEEAGQLEHTLAHPNEIDIDMVRDHVAETADGTNQIDDNSNVNQMADNVGQEDALAKVEEQYAQNKMEIEEHYSDIEKQASPEQVEMVKTQKEQSLAEAKVEYEQARTEAVGPHVAKSNADLKKTMDSENAGDLTKTTAAVDQPNRISADDETAQAGVKAYEEAKAVIPDGQEFETTIGGKQALVESDNNGVHITTFEENGQVASAVSLESDGKILNGGTRRTVDPQALKEILARKSIEESDLASAFNISMDDLNKQPEAKVRFLDLVNEFRGKHYALIDDVRGGNVNAEILSQRKLELIDDKSELLDELKSFGKTANITSQSDVVKAYASAQRMAYSINGMVDSVMKQVKSGSKWASVKGGLIGLRTSIDNLIQRGTKKPDGVFSNIVESIHKHMGEVEAAQAARNIDDLDTAMKEVKRSIGKFTESPLSVKADKIKKFLNMERDGSMVVAMHNAMTNKGVMQDGYMFELLMEANLGLPSLDLNPSTIVGDLTKSLYKASARGELFGNMTKIKAFDGIGGGLFWVAPDSPIKNANNFDVDRLYAQGIDADVGEPMIKLRYHTDGHANTKIDKFYDTKYAQLFLPVSELVNLMIDPINYKPKLITDLGGTSHAPTDYITNADVEITMTNKQYESDHFSMSRTTATSMYTSDIARMFEDNNINGSYDITFDSKSSSTPIDAKLVYKQWGNEFLPTVIREVEAKVKGEEGMTKTLSYEYPLQGVNTNIKFTEEGIAPKKATEKNSKLAAEISKRKLSQVKRDTSKDVSVIDNEDVLVVPSDSNLPHRIVSNANDDLSPSLVGAVEGAVLSMQEGNPGLSMMYYGEAGGSMTPNLNNVWLRDGAYNATHGTARITGQGAKISADGNASLKFLNLVDSKKTKSGKVASVRKNSNTNKVFLADLQKGDGVIVVANREDLGVASLIDELGDKGYKSRGAINIDGINYRIFDSNNDNPGNNSGMDSTTAFKELLKSRLEKSSEMKPVEAEPIRGIGNPIDVVELSEYSAKTDSEFSIDGADAYTTQASFDAALAYASANPDRKFVITTAKDAKTYTLKNVEDLSKHAQENVTSKTEVHIDGKTVPLGKLDDAFQAKLFQKMGVGVDQFPDMQRQSKGNPLTVAFDENGNITGVGVLEESNVAVTKRATIKAKDGNIKGVYTEGGKFTIGKDTEVISTAVKAPEPTLIGVPDAIFKHSRGGKEKGTFITEAIKFQKKLDKVAEKFRKDGITNKPDVSPDSPEGQAYAVQEALLKDPNILNLIAKSNQGDRASVSTLISQLDVLVKSVESTGAVKKTKAVKLASKDIIESVIAGVNSESLIDATTGFAKSLKVSKSNVLEVVSNFKKNITIDENASMKGAALLGHYGLTNKKLESLISNQLKAANKGKALADPTIVKSVTKFYAEAFENLHAEYKKATGKKPTELDAEDLAIASVEILSESIQGKNKTSVSEAITSVVERQEALAKNGGFSTPLALGAVVATALAAPVFMNLFRKDGQTEVADKEGNFLSWNNVLGTVGLMAVGGSLGLKGAHMVAPNFMEKTVAQNIERFMHGWQGNDIGKFVGKTSIFQYLATSPKAIVKDMSRKISNAGLRDSRLNKEFKMELDNALANINPLDKMEFFNNLESVLTATDRLGHVKDVSKRIALAFKSTFENDGVKKSIAEGLVPLVDNVERVRDLARASNLRNPNGTVRTGFYVGVKGLDKDAVISEFHTGNGLTISKDKLSRLLDAGMAETKANGHQFTEAQVASLLLNTYAVSGGQQFKSMKKKFVQVLDEKYHKKINDNKDEYLAGGKSLEELRSTYQSSLASKLSKVPRTSAEIVAHLANQVDDYQVNASGSNPVAGLFAAAEKYDGETLSRNFSVLAKNTAFASEIGVDGTKMEEFIDAMDKPALREEFFDVLRMDSGTDYKTLMEQKKNPNTPLDETDMANFTNGGLFRSAQALQANTKLSYSIVQGPKEMLATVAQTVSSFGYGRSGIGLVNSIFKELSDDDFATIKEYGSVLHSDASGEGLTSGGTRDFMSRWFEGSRRSIFDNWLGKPDSFRFKTANLATLGILGKTLDAEINLNNKAAAVFGLHPGPNQLRNLIQGHTGLSQLYRGFVNASAATAIATSRVAFKDYSSRIKLNGFESLSRSEQLWMKEAFNDADLAKLADPNRKVNESEAFTFAMHGVQSVTGVSSLASKNLRASSGDMLRWATTFKKTAANVLNSTFNNIIMPAFQGDTMPLFRLMTATGIIAPTSIYMLNAALGFNKDQEIAQSDKDNIIQKLDFVVGHTAMSIPFNAVSAVTSMLLDDDISTNVINASRQVFGANAGSMMNIGFNSAVGGFQLATGDETAGATRMLNAYRKEFKPFKEVVAFIQHGQTNQPAIQFDKNRAANDLGYWGEYISATLARKELTAPRLPSSILVGRELHSLAVEHASQYLQKVTPANELQLRQTQSIVKQRLAQVPEDQERINDEAVTDKDIRQSKKTNKHYVKEEMLHNNSETQVRGTK